MVCASSKDGRREKNVLLLQQEHKRRQPLPDEHTGSGRLRRGQYSNSSPQMGGNEAGYKDSKRGEPISTGNVCILFPLPVWI